MQAQQSEQETVQAQIQQLETLARGHLDAKAFERYTNIKLAHPEKAIQVLALVAQLVQSGKKQIGDEDLKRFLMMMESPKRETKIKRV